MQKTFDHCPHERNVAGPVKAKPSFAPSLPISQREKGKKTLRRDHLGRLVSVR